MGRRERTAPGARAARRRGRTDKAYATEVRLAVAEATCATGTPLATTARALNTQYREKLLGTYGEDLAAYQRMSLTALAHAEDITGSTA